MWAHQEGDTVHLNSWVIIPAGGFDRDSPYRVKVGVDPNRPDGIVTRVDSPNGSPSGFRSLVFTQKLDGNSIRPSESSTFPVFDLVSVFHAPHISAYSSLTFSGAAYGYVAAEDGDGTVDRRIQKLGTRPDSIVYWADTLHIAEAMAVRPKILTFFVNHAPYLKAADNTFSPKVPTAAHPLPWTVARSSTFNILADDLDPIDYARPVYRIGGPQENTPPVLVRTIDIIGKNAAGNDTTYNVATNAENANFTVSIPAYIVPGLIYVRITLADNRPNDPEHGARFLRARDRFGVVRNYFEYPVTLLGPGPEDGAAEVVVPTQRPGSSIAAGRRQ